MTTTGTTPDLSIIIATYNEAAYLERNVAAIRAVLDQTRYNYELVAIDDLSQDDTPEIVRRLAAMHPETTRTFFHSEHRGRGCHGCRRHRPCRRALCRLHRRRS